MKTKGLICCLETCNGLAFVGYTICYMAYVGIGGLIFMVVESGSDDGGNELHSRLQVVNENFIKKFPNVTRGIMDDYISDLSSAGIGGFPIANVTEPKWSFSQSVFFCMTLLTTIGYGHVAPVSQLGKAICMLYTGFGIPLTILLLTGYVQRLMIIANFLQRALATRFQRFCLKSLSIRLIFFATSFVIIGVLFFILPAVLFSQLEDNWTYMDALYFCFISLTTVGLGDFVPAKNSRLPHKEIYRFGVSLYLLVGVMALGFLMALATQCQDCIIHTQSKIEKAPCKPPGCKSMFPNYGSIVQEKVILIEDHRHRKVKGVYR